MKRILVPTDFSPNAESAWRVAVDIASRAKGTIILYHLYGLLESPFINNKISRKEYNIQTEAIVLKRLQRLKKKVLKNGNQVTISTVTGHYPLINNILGYAEHNDIDLKLFSGSYTQTMACMTERPLLIIPAEEVLTDKAIENK